MRLRICTMGKAGTGRQNRGPPGARTRRADAPAAGPGARRQPDHPRGHLPFHLPVRRRGAAVPARPGDPGSPPGEHSPLGRPGVDQPRGAARGHTALDEADALFRRALAITEQAGPANSLQVAGILNNLAVCAIERGRFGAAEPYLLRSMRLREAALAHDDPLMISLLETYALVLRK